MSRDPVANIFVNLSAEIGRRLLLLLPLRLPLVDDDLQDRYTSSSSCLSGGQGQGKTVERRRWTRSWLRWSRRPHWGGGAGIMSLTGRRGYICESVGRGQSCVPRSIRIVAIVTVCMVTDCRPTLWWPDTTVCVQRDAAIASHYIVVID